jgi:dolichol-phosphate mannosyltransferase
LLISIPTYNEAGNVESMLRRLEALSLPADYLFLDDNSPDGTGAILDALASANSRIRVLHRERRLGIGSAHQAAIDYAYRLGYRLLVTLDCDFTQPPESIPRLLAADPGAALITGSRSVAEGGLRDWPLRRRLLTRFAHTMTRHALGVPYDATNSFRLYRLDRIPAALFQRVESPGYSFFFESLFTLWRAGVCVHEVPIVLEGRTHGRSKMKTSDLLAAMQTLLRLFRRRLLGADPPLPAAPAPWEGVETGARQGGPR